MYTEPEGEDVVIDTKLTARCALFKKLLVSTPGSGSSQVQRYLSMTTGDLMIPPAISTLMDNYGKTDDNDFIVRIKDNVYTIHNLALNIAKTYLPHSDNRWKYNPVQVAAFNSLTPGSVHYGDDASTAKIRSLASEQLNVFYDTDFPITILPNTEVRVSYPKLIISTDPEEMVANYITWSSKLHESFPNIEELLYAGALTFANTSWFRDSNFDTRLNQLVPGLEGLDFNLTPNGLLQFIGWSRLKYGDYSEENMFMSLVNDGYNHLLEASYTTLARVFNLSLQPRNSFGTKAQLVWHGSKDFTQSYSKINPGSRFTDLRATSNGTCLTKIQEKGLVSCSLIFGLSRAVKYSQIYEARTNAGLSGLRSRYCTSDFKPIT
jgi:hypothetical protein